MNHVDQEPLTCMNLKDSAAHANHADSFVEQLGMREGTSSNKITLVEKTTTFFHTIIHQREIVSGSY